MKKEMLINVLQPEECRIAILEDGVLEELYVERTSHESYVGNIYKGRVVNIEPSIQAAFVDFGVGRNGFLHVSDVEPQYYRHKLEGQAGEGGKSRRGASRAPEILDPPDVELPLLDDDDDDDDEEEARPAGRNAAKLVKAEDAEEEDEEDEPTDLEPDEDEEDERPPRMPSAERRTDGDEDAGEPDEPPPEEAPAAVDAPKRERERRDADERYAEGRDEEFGAHLEVMEARAEADEPEPRQRHRGRRRPPRRGRPGAGMGRPKPPIQEIFRRGQEVLVQVIKEGIGTKGPTLSTYISIPGRYLVLMPGLNRIGVSRKIVDDEQRRRLRDILQELEPPKGLGFIIRTAGLDRTKKELQRDLAYLARLWKVVVRRIKKTKAPALIYQESDLITRTIRDIFTSEIETVWVDEQKAFEHAQEFLQIVMPRYAARIKFFGESEPLFHRYKIEDEIARIQRRHVPLPNGGSIVIDQTEALVAIDVNSGNFRADNNAEETAFRMNLLAAKEIARQLRLRDLGGVIINDFIDMREERHRREVERSLREAVKRDRARTKILKISAFGIIEMTRQRIRPSLKRSVYEDCPSCRGTGQVKTCESMSIDVMRLLQLAAHREKVVRVQVRVAEAVAQYLLNKKRKEISQLEEDGKIQVTVLGAAYVPPETMDLTCYDGNGGEIKLLPDD
jgi:ribonuclease E